MITDYKDPIVTINQVYSATTVGVTPTLGACVIGPNYFVRTFSDLGESLRLDSADNYAVQDYSDSFSPENGLKARYFPGQESTDGDVDPDSARVFVSNAQVELFPAFGESDSVVLDAGGYGTDTFSILTGAGVYYVFNGYGSDDSVPAVKAGDVVVATLEDGQIVESYIQGFIRDAGGKYTMCVLEKDLPDENITSISFRRVIDCYLDPASITVAEIDDQQTVQINSFPETTLDLGVGSTQYKVLAGDGFYAEYRCRSNRYVGSYGMVASVEDVEDMLGKICPENPLGIAVACAVRQSNGSFVYFTAVKDADTAQYNEVQAYQDACDLVADTDGIYGIVPCTTNKDVLTDIFGFVIQQSSEEVPYPKYLYASCDIPTETKLNDADLKISSVTYNDEQKSTSVKFESSPLLKMSRIVKGDSLVVSGIKYTVSRSNHKDTVYVSDDQSLNIHTGDTADIMHVLNNNADIVSRIIQDKVFSNKRASIFFADGAMYAGMQVPNYCVAAALAGMRSGTYPHAPLSNIQVASIQTTEAHGFTASQLKQLGANGFWRVGQNENGVVISRRQLTSAAADDVNQDEQSIICNIDSICLTLKHVGRDLVGNSNISPVLLTILQSTLLTQLAGFKTYVNDLIGPQLLDANLISIQQDEVHKDRIYAELEGQPPKPFNEFHMTFYVI